MGEREGGRGKSEGEGEKERKRGSEKETREEKWRKREREIIKFREYGGRAFDLSMAYSQYFTQDFRVDEIALVDTSIFSSSEEWQFFFFFHKFIHDQKVIYSRRYIFCATLIYI